MVTFWVIFQMSVPKRRPVCENVISLLLLFFTSHFNNDSFGHSLSRHFDVYWHDDEEQEWKEQVRQRSRKTSKQPTWGAKQDWKCTPTQYSAALLAFGPFPTFVLFLLNVSLPNTKCRHRSVTVRVILQMTIRKRRPFSKAWFHSHFPSLHLISTMTHFVTLQPSNRSISLFALSRWFTHAQPRPFSNFAAFRLPFS